MADILIVDDNVDDLLTMAEILEREGYKVEGSKSTRQAIGLIKKNKYDLLLVDVLMPTPGHEFVKQAKKIITKGTKVILVSIVPEQDVKTEHADGFIQKPFSPSSLLGGVKKLVKK